MTSPDTLVFLSFFFFILFLLMICVAEGSYPNVSLSSDALTSLTPVAKFVYPNPYSYSGALTSFTPVATNLSKLFSARSRFGFATTSYPARGLVFGGISNDDDILLDDLWQTDNFGDSWVRIADHAPTGGRADAIVFSFDNQIAVYGGRNSSGARQQDLWLWDIDKMAWTNINTTVQPQPRTHAMWLDSKSAFYLIGGIQNGVMTNDIWMTWLNGRAYPLALPDWHRTMQTAPFTPRIGAALVSEPYDIPAVMLGGQDANGRPLNEIWYVPTSLDIVDPVCSLASLCLTNWQQLAPAGIPWAPRWGAKAFILTPLSGDDFNTKFLYLVGGTDGQQVFDEIWTICMDDLFKNNASLWRLIAGGRSGVNSGLQSLSGLDTHYITYTAEKDDFFLRDAVRQISSSTSELAVTIMQTTLIKTVSDATPASTGSNSGSSRTIAIAVSVPIGLLLLLFIVGFFLVRYYRKQREEEQRRMQEHDQDPSLALPLEAVALPIET